MSSAGEGATGIEATVCADIAARQKLGIERYGTTVAENPLSLLEWLQHAYEESLDLPIYLKRAIVAETSRDELAAILARAVPHISHTEECFIHGAECTCDRVKLLDEVRQALARAGRGSQKCESISCAWSHFM